MRSFARPQEGPWPAYGEHEPVQVVPPADPSSFEIQSLLATPDTQANAPTSMVPDRNEPSSVACAADVGIGVDLPPPANAGPSLIDVDVHFEDAAATSGAKSVASAKPWARRIIGIATATACAGLVVAIGIAKMPSSEQANASGSQTSSVTAAAAAAAPADAPNTVSAAPAQPTELTPNNAAPANVVNAADAAEGKSLGRLTIKGQARYHRIYLDGKLLLGKGVRTFPVACGPHTVALDDRAATREVTVPCNGELAITGP